MRKKELIDYAKSHSFFCSSTFFPLDATARARGSIMIVLYKLKFNQKSSFLFSFSFSVRLVLPRIFAYKREWQTFWTRKCQQPPPYKWKISCSSYVNVIFGPMWKSNKSSPKFANGYFLTPKYLKNLDTTHSLRHKLQFCESFSKENAGDFVFWIASKPIQVSTIMFWWNEAIHVDWSCALFYFILFIRIAT